MSALSACTPASTEVALPPIESWGAFELTHPDYTSVTATKACPAPGPEVRYIDPIPKLVELARDHRIVMINEAHYKPIHRAFIGELAAALRGAGFTHYGAEALRPASFNTENRNPELVARGYPLRREGSSYVAEPLFGQLIEDVLSLDYEVFAYEVTTPLPAGARSQIAHRDSEQARVILSEIEKAAPGKLLIHAGHAHVRETPDSLGETWMAKFLRDVSGIDPLTINQTDCYGQAAFDAGVLGYAMPVDRGGNPVTDAGYDVVLIPPVEAQTRGRPAWLERASGRRFVDVPRALIRDDQYTRITAFDVTKSDEAVAEDTIYRPPYSDKALALRPGRYRVVTTDKAKAVLAETTIAVP